MSARSVQLRFWLIAALGLTGFSFSVALTQHFFEIRSGTAPFQSFCNVGESMNCDVIAASSYAQFLPGFPISSVAAGWFLALLVLALIGATQVFWRVETIRALFVWTAAGLAVSLIYLAIMGLVIGIWCLMCLAIDAAILLAFLTTLSLKPESVRKRPLDRARWKTFMTACGVCVVGSVLLLKLMDGGDVDARTRDELVQSVLTNPVLPVPKGHPALAIGPENAPVTLVEFSDFQCPFCKRGALIVNSLLNRYKKDLRVEFRNYPLDQACNPNMKSSMHPAACEAARVVFCAGMQGKFKPVYESLFEGQEALRPGIPTRWAIEAGVDQAQLDVCLASEASRDALREDIELGDRLGVKSTPTFFINGHKVEGALPVSVWIKLIDQLKREAAK